MRLREALLALHERNGCLTPQVVVEEARDPQDEVARYFHDRLTWDDEEAAEQWRLEEASALIRRAKVVYKPTLRSSVREARAFWPVPMESGSSYEPIERIAADPMMSRVMLAQAEREWRQLRARYSDLEGFVRMVQRDLDEDAA